MPAEGR